MTSVPKLPCYDLGLAPYEPVQTLQRSLRRECAANRHPGALLLLEHEGVITLGMRASRAEVLRPSADRSAAPALPVFRSERGGLVTLHAPGQLVAYPVLHIPGRDLRGYVWRLEETARLLLAHYGAEAVRSTGRPGLYVDGCKIASLGLRCERWVASHGISVNISPDLRLFEQIVSCGDPGLRQTSLAVLTGRTPPMAEVKLVYSRSFAEVFGSEVARPLKTSVAALQAALPAPDTGSA